MRADFCTCDRPLIGDVLVFPFRVRPAVREDQSKSVACEHLIHREAVDHHGATIAAEDLAPFVGRFTRQDAIEGDGRRVPPQTVPADGLEEPSRGQRVSSTLITGAASARVPSAS